MVCIIDKYTSNNLVLCWHVHGLMQGLHYLLSSQSMYCSHRVKNWKGDIYIFLFDKLVLFPVLIYQDLLIFVFNNIAGL